MTFRDWQEALPYGLGYGRKFAQCCPLGIDVESVVMEALWKAQLAGKEFTKAYVCIRVRGALQDEMRSVAEGTRGNYQNASSFVEVDEAYGLAAEIPDALDTLDRRRLLEAMPPAAVTLVQHLADGETQEQMATRYQVSASRMSQVLSDLKSRPTRPRQLPRHVDFYAELRKYHQAEMRRLARGAVTGGELHRALGACPGSAWKWASAGVALPSVRANTLMPSPLREAIRARALTLVGDALQHANGRFREAARLLTVSPMTAYRWSKLLPAGAVPNLGKRRLDLPDTAFTELRGQGLSLRAIARRLGVNKSTVTARLSRARPIAKCRHGIAEAAE